MMIANAHVFAAPDGQKGFDCDHVLTADDCKRFLDAQYDFAVRYIPRVTRHARDLTPEEVDVILTSGLGLMPVQHVEAADPPWWVPSGNKGGQYGATAAREAIACGIPAGVSVWCDLEGVKPRTPSAVTIAFCNRWHRSVLAGGFLPGCYVGFYPGLSGKQLREETRFTSFWRAYNGDVIPAVRAFQMKQSSITEIDKVPGVDWFTTDSSDVNHTMADKLGGRAQILAVPPIPTIGG